MRSATLSSLPELADESEPSGIRALTPRQYEVLRGVAAGFDNKVLAEQLHIEISSLVNHLTAIYAKMNIPEGSNPRVYSTLRFIEHETRGASAS